MSLKKIFSIYSILGVALYKIIIIILFIIIKGWWVVSFDVFGEQEQGRNICQMITP